MNPRFQALKNIQSREYIDPIDKSKKASEIFGESVFSDKVMRQYLPKEVYQKLKSTIATSKPIDREIAGQIAMAMKNWALEKGATHFTHWFQPLTGLTAEKHDSFFELTDEGPIEKFSGSELAQQEPDASSFPSGGLRNTFEARGYTAWDSSSPAFIFETRYGRTLCIPTIFVSYTGEALGYKAPLLRSMSLLDEAATEVCQYFDPKVAFVTATLGPEQEYFLIDRAYYDLRPDLMLTGRTVFGAAPARGQQLDDHYFGSIPVRAFAFMNELEREAHRLGIPLKTRHNEVAPSQFECAPRFEELNISVDHNQLLVDLIDRVAHKHNLRALLHEKPFAGINGSGKHNNWSMATSTGKNLLSPGSNPQENLMFLTFFSIVIRAVYEHADLLRASIASAGNDHRLGANEAPPAIISIFIGSQLSQILNDIVNPPRRKRKEEPNPYLQLGIPKIPEILLDNTDRNRTSPFAFTGNKFEFRAVGSAANNAQPMTILNVIVANQLRDFKDKVDRKIKRGRKKASAILDIIRDYLETSEAIRFEGNGYSKEWEEEAAKRGLSNLRKTPEALATYISEKATKLFTENGIYSKSELHARYEVMLENYLNKVEIEAQVIEEIAQSQIVPVAVKYQQTLLENVRTAKEVGLSLHSYDAQLRLAEKVGEHIDGIMSLLAEMRAKKADVHTKENSPEIAAAFAENVIPFFDKIREHVDELESHIPDQEWPLPKYREMLFVR